MDLDGLLGRRVSLRYRVRTERDGGVLHSDAVGELARDGTALTVHTRRGPVRIDADAVVAVRAVPPAPPRRASLSAVARLEELCADAWPAQVDERLGGWRLRAAGGFTGRANSALAIGDPGMPVPAALDVAGRFAARHGLGPRVQVPVGSPWDRAVEAQGWVLDAGHEAGAEVSVLVVELTDLAGHGAGTPAGIELPEQPSDEWWALGPGTPSTAQRAVLDPGGVPPVAFALARDADGTAQGALRAAVVEDHLHLSLLAVRPEARRQGRATALLAAAAEWGRGHGAGWGVLQVALQNTGAATLYDRLGFVEHHRYRYLVPPS